MNNRIKELVDKADLEAPGGQWKDYFAELIIKECVISIRALDDDAPYDEWTSGYTSAIISAAEALEERFGIKE